jgi:peptidoglycan/LPS O-acetylase OafA/YrhL
VILVLLFHFQTPGFGAGFIGVDVFFVISGFLMTGIILRGIDAGDFSIPRFYRARLIRLYPALLAAVAEEPPERGLRAQHGKEVVGDVAHH